MSVSERAARIIHRAQDAVVRAFGLGDERRSVIVERMHRPRPGDAAGYWLQLTIATLLATLGLALDSTAVVIGAMLIAPLMRPLVELAMGLATGSAQLATRAMVRTIASIAVVTILATAVTFVLPFHDLTGELRARTFPSLLDLAVAGACALAAGYATIRTGTDIATTAAGTSIGISLVPPLCAAGYGLALNDFTVARGAALLFTANLSGILAVTTLIFVAAGFSRVELEAADEPGATWGRRAARRAVRRLGPIARFVPPVVLLAIVVFPLARAVREIQHRSELRETVAKVLDGHDHRIVDYTVEHDADGLVVHAVVVGDAAAASQLDHTLRARLREHGVAAPRVTVWAVPDAASLSALAHRIDELPPPPTPEPPRVVAHRFTADLGQRVRDMWPASAPGPLIAASLDLDHPGHLRLVHLGAPLGATALAWLARAVDPDASPPLQIDEVSLAALDAPAVDGERWLPGALALIERIHENVGLHACVTAPASTPPHHHRGSAVPPAIREALAAALGDADLLTDGDHWSVTPSTKACTTPTP